MSFDIISILCFRNCEKREQTETDATKRKRKETTPESKHQLLLSKVPLSELEMIEKDGHLTLLKHERKVLLEKINSTIVTFDKAIADLRQERFKLTADLKTTDMKLLTHYQELKILQEFGGREEELNKKLQKCRAEKAEVVVDLTECQDKLSAKLQEIQAWQEKDKRIMGEFNSIVGGDKSEFYVPLLKIFKK
eukprot:35010_1